MKERMKFLLEWEARWNAGEGRMNFAELCREFGVSRQVGYVWLRRFRESKHDPEVAIARSRRPHTTPTKVQEAVEELVVEARKAHPTWGPKKLCAWLRHHFPQLEVPAPSTVGEILNRRGLTVTRLRRRYGTRHARAPSLSPRVQRRAPARSPGSNRAPRALRGVAPTLPAKLAPLRLRPLGSTSESRRQGLRDLGEAAALSQRGDRARARFAQLPRGRLGRGLRAHLARPAEAARQRNEVLSIQRKDGGYTRSVRHVVGPLRQDGCRIAA